MTERDSLELGRPEVIGDPADQLHSDLTALAEMLIEALRDDGPLKESATFHNASRLLRRIKVAAIARQHVAVVKVLTAIDATLQKGFTCGEKAKDCAHLKRARFALGALLTALEGGA